MSSGTGKQKSSSAQASSAKPPWPRKNAATAITRAPTRARAPCPASRTTPASSWPGVNGSFGVSAYEPRHMNTSGRPMPHASTRTRSIPGGGAPSTTSASASAELGSPPPTTCHARIAPLTPLEVRLALLSECERTLLRVLAREHGLAVVPLVAQRLVELHPVALVQRARDRLDRERAVRANHLGDLARLRERLPVGHDVPDQADLLRLRRADVLAREQDVCRVRVWDLARQAHHRPAHRVERPARLGHAEARALAGDADLHRLDDLGAARDRH